MEFRGDGGKKARAKLAVDRAEERAQRDEDRAKAQAKNAEAEVFIDQARWLLDYHDRRSDSLAGRSVALLGFVGVILALVARAQLPEGVEPTGVVVTAAVVTLALLLAAAALAIRTITVRPLQAPGVNQLRENWRLFVDAQRPGRAWTDVTETFLRAKRLTEPSVINAAIEAADSRARSFRWAARLLGAALVGLTVVIVSVVYQVYF